MKIIENGFELEIDKCFRDIATICAKRELDLHGGQDGPAAAIVNVSSAYFAAMGYLSTLSDEAVRELIHREG